MRIPWLVTGFFGLFSRPESTLAFHSSFFPHKNAYGTRMAGRRGLSSEKRQFDHVTNETRSWIHLSRGEFETRKHMTHQSHNKHVRERRRDLFNRVENFLDTNTTRGFPVHLSSLPPWIHTVSVSILTTNTTRGWRHEYSYSEEAPSSVNFTDSDDDSDDDDFDEDDFDDDEHQHKKRFQIDTPRSRMHGIIMEHLRSLSTSAAQGKGSQTRVASSSNTFRLEDVSMIGMNFSCIGGYDMIKQELAQITDFMQHPDKYTKYNVRLPRGILLHGDPGTGKTLFARCVAGECRLPFIATSGSEFQEKYVGVGASRMRELFTFARENSPCIIFIDEMDGVARRRGSDAETAQAERDTTLNQLLVEMDGFGNNDGILVIGATNRVDILDPAVLRPGRFDKHVHINLPDFENRQKIIDIHRQGKPIECPTRQIASLTHGMTGAQIENMLNEASLYGIRTAALPINETVIERFHEYMTVGRSLMTPQFSRQALRRIAVHEVGHAVTAYFLEPHGKPRKLSIQSPSGTTAGYTSFHDTDEHHKTTDDDMKNVNENDIEMASKDHQTMSTREFLESRLCVLLGGRVAEEIVFGVSVSAGAAHDFAQCLVLARRMILEFGMGTQVTFSSMSEASRQRIDKEISWMIQKAYKKTMSLLMSKKDMLTVISNVLVETKTLDRTEFETLINTIGDVMIPTHERVSQ